MGASTKGRSYVREEAEKNLVADYRAFIGLYQSFLTDTKSEKGKHTVDPNDHDIERLGGLKNELSSSKITTSDDADKFLKTLDAQFSELQGILPHWKQTKETNGNGGLIVPPSQIEKFSTRLTQIQNLKNDLANREKFVNAKNNELAEKSGERNKAATTAVLSVASIALGAIPVFGWFLAVAGVIGFAISSVYRWNHYKNMPTPLKDDNKPGASVKDKAVALGKAWSAADKTQSAPVPPLPENPKSPVVVSAKPSPPKLPPRRVVKAPTPI
jgi:hypothetical protein